ncbi:uncharacterized protein H6S33_008058 [Morchella sextelata]|uniref:uncharacterized protein n=1 Tax=Morchella sextelata TaxID=1174677 RepID=UPI001D03B13A|nr:uncharacterized protein H6S33_008058 [Morchella sextelata]KAH0603054.1 hypothetical protein H6S33_008058 [Morchella sextelata]
MDTALSALHFYQPLLDRAAPTFTLTEQLRVLRQSLTVYESVLRGIQRRLRTVAKNNSMERKELREKGEWYARTYRALKENERDIVKAMVGGPGNRGVEEGGVGR